MPRVCNHRSRGVKSATTLVYMAGFSTFADANVTKTHLGEVHMAAKVCRTGAVVAGLILAGCAGTALKPNAAGPAVATIDTPCLTATGSRIPASETNCMATGRAYTNDDIKLTGATSAGDALRLLDSSITVHR